MLGVKLGVVRGRGEREGQEGDKEREKGWLEEIFN